MPVLSESHICKVSKEIEGESNTDGGEPEEYPPKKLVSRLDVREEGGLGQGKGMALSQTQVARTEEDCEITDSKEQEPVQANTSSLLKIFF